ncbi:MAG: hypothetical protein Q9M33_09615 [Robiginitomaculum sp.]|nr:hypothetical protein [Robiginitomaculum sp.]MDQ7077744.1 hypothetical protein [Robiginitomaculum sp.]
MDTKNIVIAFARLVLRGVLYSLAIGAVLILCAQFSFVRNIDLDEGLIEWLQFVILLGGMVALALRADPTGRWWRYLVVLGLFVLAMEEIDWAQPYLGYPPLSVLAQNNAYGEMALHNAFGMEKYLRMVLLLAVMAGGVTLLTFVALQRGLEGLIAYVRKIFLLPGALFAGGVLALVAGRLMHPGDYFSFDEFGELSIYAGVVLFILSRPFEGLKRVW